MQLFNVTQTEKLSQEKIIRAMQFARDVISTIDYRDSNQDNLQKIEDDHFISKIGEEAVFQTFAAHGANITPPDYHIYSSKEKSWSADLIVNGADLAVKTQKSSVAKRYGLSWTFQSSKIRRDPIVQDPEAWICFVECNDLHADFPCRIFPPRQTRSLIFRNPKLQHLIGKKLVVYADDLHIL